MNVCNGIEDCRFFENCKKLGKLVYIGGYDDGKLMYVCGDDDDGEHYITTLVNTDKLSLLNLCPRKDFPNDGLTFLDLLEMYAYVQLILPDCEVPCLNQLVKEATALGVYAESPKLDNVKYKRMSLDSIEECGSK